MTLGLALEIADKKRLRVIRSTDDSSRAIHSQYLTPPETAHLAARLFSDAENELKALDLGAGTGILSVALFERYGSKISIDAVEYDERIARHYRTEANKVNFSYCLFEQDALLWDSPTEYDRVILNPPYKKMNATDIRMRNLPVKVPNLYAAFICVAINHLRLGGECVAIIPRSWMNGQYFTPFRKWILGNASIDALHVYGSRGDVFSDTDVLQETMLVKFSKRVQAKHITVSSSSGRYGHILHNEFPSCQLIDYTADDVVIGIEPKNQVVNTHDSLSERGYCASTGKVVDFRTPDYLEEEPLENCIELFYPCNFHGMTYGHPVNKGKKQWFRVEDDFSKKQLVGAGNYVVVKRFSAKEEKRRVYASFFSADHAVALENHLNFIHAGSPRNVVPLDQQIAKGLTMWLNSTVVDDWFRAISGSTQVNASDLKKIPTPPEPILRELGAYWSPELAQCDVDRICSEVANV